MRIVKEGYYRRILYQVKIRNRYVTVATLQEHILSLTKYKFIFSYYGRDTSFTIKLKEDELYDEMVERVAKMVKKKLYLIADEILTSIRKPDRHMIANKKHKCKTCILCDINHLICRANSKDCKLGFALDVDDLDTEEQCAFYEESEE